MSGRSNSKWLVFSPGRDGAEAGFSLVEMLVVISIAAILSLLASVGFQNVVGPVFNGQVSDIASTLARARAYAMANNTYVFVGIQELDASKSRTGAQTSGTGRVAVTVMASQDGTRGYLTSSGSSTALNSLAVVSPLRVFDNLHIATGSGLSNLPNTSDSGSSYVAASAPSLTTFTWPPGAASNYPAFGSNGTVIQFNPRGEAQIFASANSDCVFQWIEIDLISTHGIKVSTANPATILVDGASGSVTIYRK